MRMKKPLNMRNMELADIKQCRVCHGYNLFKSTLLLQDIISDKYKLTHKIKTKRLF